MSPQPFMVCNTCYTDKSELEFRVCDKKTKRRRKQCIPCEHNEKNARYQSNKPIKPAGYNCWQSMIQRCTNPNNNEYLYYGGRGITVFDGWLKNFDIFIKHIGPRPTLKHTINRIDNNQGYWPGNVEWATAKQQNRNKRNNHWLTLNDQTKTVMDWAKEIGISHVTLIKRLQHGWSVIETLTTPLGPSSKRY